MSLPGVVPPIGTYLRDPILPTRPWRKVLRAGYVLVPEAAVDEDNFMRMNGAVIGWREWSFPAA
jgi:hypothetical protein